MKFAPPGSEPYRTLTRIDGWLGSDPSRYPEFSRARDRGSVAPV
jgi:hypothetical protein